MAYTSKSKSTTAAAISFTVDSSDSAGFKKKWMLHEVRCHASAAASYTIKIDSGLGSQFDVQIGSASTVTDYHFVPTRPIRLASADSVVIESADAVDHGVEVILERV